MKLTSLAVRGRAPPINSNKSHDLGRYPSPVDDDRQDKLPSPTSSEPLLHSVLLHERVLCCTLTILEKQRDIVREVREWTDHILEIYNREC